MPYVRRHLARARVVACICLLSFAASLGSPQCVAPSSARSLTRAVAAIVGGHPAHGMFFGSLAAISDRQGAVVGECTGTVIGPRYILTAGHCVVDFETGGLNEPSGYTVTTGAVPFGGTARATSRVEHIFVDPRFNPPRGTFDAAVLVLATPTSAAPVALPQPSSGLQSAAGTPAYVAGWGLTSSRNTLPPSEPQEARFEQRSNHWCESRVPRFDVTSEICGTHLAGAAISTCNGDSGGPLLVAEHPTRAPLEVGVVSRGPNRCLRDRPTTFTRVAAVARWVRSVVQSPRD